MHREPAKLLNTVCCHKLRVALSTAQKRPLHLHVRIQLESIIKSAASKHIRYCTRDTLLESGRDCGRACALRTVG